ncbi:MAG: gliding motility-associated C-terminal domain-containing protein [Bacteroidia bacterium]|nr:gliding motility-associated C-terminal domain-containing protein [Bacteroidia bacterium]
MEFRKICLSLVLLSFWGSMVCGQTFFRVLGVDGHFEGPVSMACDANDNFYVGGWWGDSTLVMKLNSNGDRIWSKWYRFLPGLCAERVNSLRITSDNNIIGVGECTQGANSQSFYFKIDLNGNLLWAHRNTNSSYTVFLSIVEKNANEYIVLGGNNPGAEMNGFLRGIDASNGNKVWETPVFTRSYYSLDDFHYPLIDGGNLYVLGRGMAADLNLQASRPCLSRFSLQGSPHWSRMYVLPPLQTARLYSGNFALDGDSLIVGMEGDFSGTSSNFTPGLFSLDKNGNIGWAKKYPFMGSGMTLVRDVLVVNDGFLVWGSNQDQPIGLFLFKTDKKGVPLWGKSYDSPGNSLGLNYRNNHSALIRNGFLYAVGTIEVNGGDRDIFFMKADLNGEVSCGVDVIDVQVPYNVISNPQDGFYPFITQNNPVTYGTALQGTGSVTLPNPCEPLPGFGLGPDQFHCTGTPILLDPQVNATSYLWSDGSTGPVLQVSTAGTYWVEVEENCCFWRDTIVIKNQSPYGYILGKDTSMCPGDSFYANASVAGATNFLWNTGATQPGIWISSPGVYIVNFKTDSCLNKDTLVVDSGLGATLYLGPDTALCLGDTLFWNFSIPGAVFSWWDGSTQSFNQTTEPGTYWISAAKPACEGSDTIQISRKTPPHPVPGREELICKGESLLVDISQSGMNYLWQDGFTGPFRALTDSGAYLVEISNRCGTEEAEILLDTEECECEVFMPNVLTPNYDDFNETFGLEVNSDCQVNWYELVIFDRWGHKIWESHDIHDRWDGKYGSNLATPGVYFYVVQFSGTGVIRTVERRLTGTVTLLR